MPTQPVNTYELANNRLDPLYAHDAHEQTVGLKPAATGTVVYPRGTVLGEITATPGVYGPYAAGNADGTQNPSHLLRYACTVDTAGNITNVGEWGQTHPSTDAFYSGTFRTQELVGLDTAAIAKLAARLTEGNIAQGIIHLG